MDYYGNGIYMTNLLVYVQEEINQSEIRSCIQKTKELFPMRAKEKTLLIYNNKYPWLGIDCDSIHEQLDIETVQICLDIWKRDILLYDIFDEDVLILGFGKGEGGKAHCCYSNDLLVPLEERYLELPQDILTFFKGNEAVARNIWKEDFCMESDRLLSLLFYMTKDKVPIEMLLKRDIKELSNEFERLIL